MRWFCEPGPPSASAAGTWRALAARAWAEATSGPDGPGPVHLNLAFDEPLWRRARAPSPRGGPGAPLATTPRAGTSSRRGRSAGWPARRGVVVAGARCGGPAAVLGLAARLGWPVLADPRSGCRTLHPCVVGAADLLARSDPLRRSLLPEVVLLVGDPWTSKAVARMVAEASAAGAEVVAVDPWWRWVDPDRVVTAVRRADPGPWLEAVAGIVVGEGDGGWLEAWQAAERAAQRAVDEVLAAEAGLTEPAVARTLPGALPAGSVVVAASSMPVRDPRVVRPPAGRPAAVLSNRGANGIDGVSATAQGVAAAGVGPVVGLLGDLAFLHDASSLVRPAAAPPGASCTLVVVDNGGGGIFSFLPQAGRGQPDRFEQLFGTPQATDGGLGGPGLRPVRDRGRRAGRAGRGAGGDGGHPAAGRGAGLGGPAGRQRGGARAVGGGGGRGLSAVEGGGHPAAVEAEGHAGGEVDDGLGGAPNPRRRGPPRRSCRWWRRRRRTVPTPRRRPARRGRGRRPALP